MAIDDYEGLDPYVPLPNASKINTEFMRSFVEQYGDGTPVVVNTEGAMLPEGIKDIPLWRDLMDVMDEVIASPISTHIQDLVGINDPHYSTNSSSVDRPTLLLLVGQLGLKYERNDIFDDSDLKRLIRHLPKFWAEKGYRNFIEYMSYAVNAELKLQYLWTEDFEVFVPEGGAIGTPVWEGGTWYPTSHVYIAYDVSKFTSTVNSGFSSLTALSKYFYSIAPINLVLRAFTTTILLEPIQMRIGGDIEMTVTEPNDTAFTPKPLV